MDDTTAKEKIEEPQTVESEIYLETGQESKSFLVTGPVEGQVEEEKNVRTIVDDPKRFLETITPGERAAIAKALGMQKYLRATLDKKFREGILTLARVLKDIADTLPSIAAAEHQKQRWTDKCQEVIEDFVRAEDEESENSHDAEKGQ